MLPVADFVPDFVRSARLLLPLIDIGFGAFDAVRLGYNVIAREDVEYQKRTRRARTLWMRSVFR